MLVHEKIKKDQDLLSHILFLPNTEMKQLTNVSQYILTAMKVLLNIILEQSKEAIMQLCMQ